MIMPDMHTAVSRCQDLALHTEQMLAKFADNPRLTALIPRIRGGSLGLEDADRAYASELRALMRLRIDVHYENYVSDRRVRRTRKQASFRTLPLLGPPAWKTARRRSCPAAGD